MASYLKLSLKFERFRYFYLTIHMATGLWLTMMGLVAIRVFSSDGRTLLTSFQGFATAPIRWRSCSINPNNMMSYHAIRLRTYPGAGGSKERSLFYEKRNYYQCYRKRNQDCDN